MKNHRLMLAVFVVVVLGLLTVMLTVPPRARAALFLKMPAPYGMATSTPAVSHLTK